MGKDMEKFEPTYIAGRSVRWCNHCEKQFGGSQ